MNAQIDELDTTKSIVIKKRIGFKPSIGRSQWSRGDQGFRINDNHHIEINNDMYVNSYDFDIKNLVIKERKSNDKFVRFAIRYKYGDSTNDTSIEAPLKIMFNNFKLSQSRHGAISYKNDIMENSIVRRYFCPYDRECDAYKLLQQILSHVKKGFVEHIKSCIKYTLDDKNIDKFIESKPFVSMTNRTGKICKIIKLGSKSENNIDQLIHTIDDFNNLLMDYRYNKQNSDSFYRTNSVIGFCACLYIKREGTDEDNGNCVYMSSVKPYISLMEMSYNKASCISAIDLREKTCPIDSVLTL